MSDTPPYTLAKERVDEMQPPSTLQVENGSRSDREYRAHSTKDSSKEDRPRSRSRDHGGREKDKERGHDKDKDRKKSDRSHEKERDRDRDRDRQRESRDHDVERDRRKPEREDRDRRDKDRNRERDNDRHRETRDIGRNRDSRSQRSRSRTNDEYNNRRKRRSRSRPRRDRERERSRSRSYERRRRDRNSRDRGDRSSRDRDNGRGGRSSTIDRERERMDRDSKLGSIREESRNDNRFDLTQTIQELMNSTNSAKNFAALFNCQNSNDSFSNQISENSQDGTERKRKRKSRWGGNENDKTFIPGMPTILPSTLDPTQQEAYLVQLQIEEISRKLRTGDLGIPQNLEERSPSPEPIYSSDGKRLNTREFRFRKRLEEQRHQLIQKMQSVNPEFKPPADYKPPVTRVSDKVLIPQEQHPDINFVGLLIGPRGNTLKAMEKETGAKIIIRGKGSVKEGKVGRKDGQPLPGEDEPLHAFITAANPEAVKKAVDKIKDVIRQGIEVPEGHNDLRRMQLRELAQLNGTLRETDCQRCTNCGSSEHKSWLCPDKPNVTNSIVCTSCGGAGHISKDCRSKRPGAACGTGEQSEDSQAKIDEEYMSLMAELGEGPPPSSIQKLVVDPLAQAHLNRGYSLFDKKPNQPMQAIQAPPPSNHQAQMSLASMHATAPPPPIPPSAWAAAASMGMPPMMPPTGSQPPPPPMMPWMPTAQPPPPGGDTSGIHPPMPGGALPPPPPPGTSASLQPPGTGPMPPLLPPPPGTSSASLPPWSTAVSPPGIMPPHPYGGWGAGGYLPPPPPGSAPPPPPLAPLPPGLSGLTQPPPPPPPTQ